MDIIEDGQLDGEFNGFEDEKVTFEFSNGNKYQQDEYKYNYHYAYRPDAKVIDTNGSLYLEVDGMSEKVRVKQVF